MQIVGGNVRRQLRHKQSFQRLDPAGFMEHIMINRIVVNRTETVKIQHNKNTSHTTCPLGLHEGTGTESLA